MGRKPVAELCIFCGQSPCTCADSKPARTTKPRKVAAPKPDAEDPFATVVVPPAKSKFEKAGADIHTRDLSAESVLRLIRPLLNEVDQKKVDDLLHHPIPQDVDRLESEWRKRNGLGKFHRPR